MLINKDSYQRKADCFKLDRDSKRRENASTVTVRKSNTFLKDER